MAHSTRPQLASAPNMAAFKRLEQITDLDTVRAIASVSAWETLHTSGHASPEDLRHVIEKADPQLVISMHTDAPQEMQALCPDRTVVLLKDGEELSL